jgi:hypothetical protein
MPLQPGQVLNNRYRIVRLLGQGGFGAVYRAWDINLNRPCAVKENLDVSPEAQRQFMREATVLANLSHPNLPRVTDHFVIEGQGQYLVMDFVEGEDLASLVQRNGKIEADQARVWILQVADALTYLHTRTPPVVHRDIKPANIRITPDGRAMLVDFGLVKIYNPNMQTTLGARAVTPGYAPPEQYGQGSTDPRTDIYALGATFYKLLTGQEPLESVQRMAGREMPGISQFNEAVPVNVTQAIERSMKLEPSQRFQDASEFKRSLDIPTPTWDATMLVKPVPAAQVRPAVQAPAVSSSPVARKSNRLILWIGIAVVVLFCLGGAALVGLYLVGEQQASTDATAKAELRTTLDARVRTTSTSQALNTMTAQAGATATADQARVAATAEARATATAYMAATEQAWANYVATLEAGRTLVFGPQSGSLVHEAEDELIEGENADVNLKNFIIEATFYNPYDTSTGTWDYGFILRHVEENVQYRFVTQSDQTWTLMNNSGDPDGKVIGEGELPGLNINANGSNVIKLIFKDAQGLFYLNGEFIAELDLSERSNSGDIYIVTGVYSGDEITGETTKYSNFTIWSLP